MECSEPDDSGRAVHHQVQAQLVLPIINGLVVNRSCDHSHDMSCDSHHQDLVSPTCCSRCVHLSQSRVCTHHLYGNTVKRAYCVCVCVCVGGGGGGGGGVKGYRFAAYSTIHSLL